ncbi:MAG: hypothetical protein OIF55_14705, partial [Amphritea sp.]|nr:hypothetical protein [Amphritea sp.]
MSDIKAEIEQFRTDMSLAHQLVHGDDTVEVDTESGKRPSLAKAIKENIITPNNETGVNKQAALDAQGAAEKAESGAAVSATAAKQDAD